MYREFKESGNGNGNGNENVRALMDMRMRMHAAIRTSVCIHMAMTCREEAIMILSSSDDEGTSVLSWRG